MDKTIANLRSVFIQQQAIVQNGFSKDTGWVILNEVEARIKEKIERIGVPLKEWDVQINYGIKTGFNEAFIIDAETREELLKKCPKADEIIRPILRGKDIGRYSECKPNQWVIYIPWHFPLHLDLSIKGASIKAEEQFEENYQVLYDYLSHYRAALENRNKAETGIRYEWYALQRYGSNYWQDFEKEKIVWGNLSLRASFTFVKSNIYLNAPSAFIPTDDLFILGFLNSRLSDFYISLLGVSRNGGYFEYKPMFVEQIPIPQLRDIEKRPIIDKVEKILYGSLPKDTVSNLENEIDQIIYQIFELTDEQIEIINKISSS